MADLEHQKPGGKPARNKKKRSRKAEPQRTPAEVRAVSEAVDAAMAEPVETVAEVASEQAVESAAAVEATPAVPVERVASFKERMASVMPPADTTHHQPVKPAEVAQAAPSPTAAPVAGIQAIANAYRDYTRKSLEDAQTFAEKLSAARSLDKAVEAQTEFARQACETFADNSRKIRELHRELFWQAFRLPNWPPGRTR